MKLPLMVMWYFIVFGIILFASVFKNLDYLQFLCCSSVCNTLVDILENLLESSTCLSHPPQTVSGCSSLFFLILFLPVFPFLTVRPDQVDTVFFKQFNYLSVNMLASVNLGIRERHRAILFARDK